MKPWLLGREDGAMVSGKSPPEGSRSGSNASGTDKRLESRLQIGVGRELAHHGELLQGVFEGEDGRLHRGLVSLPLATQQSMVTFWSGEQGNIHTRPAGRRKAARAAAQDVTAGRDGRHLLAAAIGLPMGVAAARFSAEVHSPSSFQTVLPGRDMVAHS